MVPYHLLALMSFQIDLSPNKHLRTMLPAERPTSTRPRLQHRILKGPRVYKLKCISQRALSLERKSHLLMCICKSKPACLWRSHRHAKTKPRPAWLGWGLSTQRRLFTPLDFKRFLWSNQGQQDDCSPISKVTF